MANHQNAIKAQKQSETRRVRNRQNKSRMRTAIKRFRKELAEGNTETAQGLLNSTLSMVDRTVKLGGLHANSAARTKSRLARALNRAVSAISG